MPKIYFLTKEPQASPSAALAAKNIKVLNLWRGAFSGLGEWWPLGKTRGLVSFFTFEEGAAPFGAHTDPHLL